MVQGAREQTHHGVGFATAVCTCICGSISQMCWSQEVVVCIRLCSPEDSCWTHCGIQQQQKVKIDGLPYVTLLLILINVSIKGSLDA